MRDVILTDRGPKPIGPYSQAIRTNGFLYVSGQVALDPKTGEMTGADVRQQTERTLENIKGILEAAGSNLHHVVKTTVFLKDMNDFAAMNVNSPCLTETRLPCYQITPSPKRVPERCVQ